MSYPSLTKYQGPDFCNYIANVCAREIVCWNYVGLRDQRFTRLAAGQMSDLPPACALLFSRHRRRQSHGKSASAGLLGVTIQGPVFYIMPSAALISCLVLRSFRMENSTSCKQMDLRKLLGLLWLCACTPPSFCPIKWWETCLADFTGSPSSILTCFDLQVLHSFSLGCHDRVEKNHKSHLTLQISPVFALQCKTEGSSFIPFNCTPFYIQVYPYTSGTGVPTELEMTGYLFSCLFLAIIWLLMSRKSLYLLRQKAEDLSATPASSEGSDSHRASLPKAATDQKSTEKYS